MLECLALRPRFRRTLPGAPERMRFGIEDDFAEIQGLGRSEEEIKIFECLGQNEALHFIALTLGHDISKRGVAAPLLPPTPSGGEGGGGG